MTTSKPVSELARKLADTLIRKIVKVALEHVQMRWEFHPTEEEHGMGDLQDCINDTIRCMNGEEFGCLDPDDEEDAEQIEQYINEYAADIETVAALTRKQTLEECARLCEKQAEPYPEDIFTPPTAEGARRDLERGFVPDIYSAAGARKGIELCAAAIREMEVKA